MLFPDSAVRGVILALFVVAAPVGGVDGQETVVRVSKARLGASEVTVDHRIDPSTASRGFDLDKVGAASFPGVAVLSTSVPLISGGQIIPPGEHRLGLHNDESQVVSITLESLSSRHQWRWPARVGEFDSPILGTRVTVSSEELRVGGSKSHRGGLEIRWRSWVFEVPFQAVETARDTVTGWRLDSNKLTVADGSPAVSDDGPTFLGTVTETRSGRSRRIYLEVQSAQRTVRFVDVRLDQLAKTRRQIDAELLVTSPEKERRIGALRSRLKTLDSEVRQVAVQDAEQSGPITWRRGSSTSPMVSIRLTETSSDVLVQIAGPQGVGTIRLVPTPTSGQAKR